MKIYLFFLVLAWLKFIGYAIQFEDERNLGQRGPVGTPQIIDPSSGFFPASEEIDNRYSEGSGLKYVDYESFSDIRKQNFNGNLPVYSSPPQHTPTLQTQYYHQQPQRPATINHPNTIRQRPKFPYQFASPSTNYYSEYPPDFSNPIYQNYANYYQYASSSSSPTANYEHYNPTRYPSPPQTSVQSANLYGHQQLQNQQQLHYPPNYYTNNYANQFGYQRPSSSGALSGVSNFFNNIRDGNSPVAAPLNQLSQVGTQFSKALEDISINDDLQCVPKLLCSMIRNPRRPNQLPSFLNIPGLTAIISALPSSSPIMNFGRAALLGISGGECEVSYPRCPRDENQLLYYLNNHRGGFFRFFNGGNSFGDENYLQALQNVNQQQLAGTGQGLNLLALQALADAFNGGNGNGFNLNNLFSSTTTSSQYQRPAVQQNYQGLQGDQSQGLFSMLKPSTLTDVVSNLLTGVVGNRFSRRISKRSVGQEGHAHHQIQKRIINLKDDEQNFFQGPQNQNQHVNTLFDDLNDKPFTFSNDNRDNLSSNRQQYALKFPHEQGESFTTNGMTFISSADVAQRLKMLFPDIENFSEQFNQNLYSIVGSRIGRIVNQPPVASSNYYSINRYSPTTTTTRPQYYNAGSSSSNYNNRYQNNNRHQQPDQRHIVYVTNSRGEIEYKLNELTGEKTYL